jgi:aminocarboxymuconate-semialdehyde decarboxylase
MARAKKPKKRASGRGPKKPFAIDLHAHLIVPEVRAFAAKHLIPMTPPKGVRLNAAQLKRLAKWRAELDRRFSDTKTRVREMDKAGVDIQVITTSLVHQCTYWAAPTESLKMERLSNDRLAETVAARPDRFIGLGGVPLGDTRKAVRELERCLGELGLKGVQISSMAGKRELGDAKVDPFWKRAEELGALITIHPAGLTEARHQRYYLWNSVGQPLEEIMAMSSLIYEGVLEKFPKLNILVGHGGGYLPFYAGRHDRNYLEKPATTLNMTKSPSAYLRDFHYDTCVYNRDMLEFLVGKVGAGRIVLGSDYPAGEADPIGFVTRSRKISAADKERILWRNAAKLLRISV